MIRSSFFISGAGLGFFGGSMGMGGFMQPPANTKVAIVRQVRRSMSVSFDKQVRFERRFLAGDVSARHRAANDES
jgi:hypothetical protein